MKKQFIAIIFAIIMSIGLTACNRTDDNAENDAATEAETDTEKENYITEDEAKTKALAHAKLEDAEVTYTRVNQDTKEGREVYEIEFYYDDKEYDYDIDAITGDIISHSSETDTNAENAGDDIGEEAARALILEKAEGAAEENIEIERNMNDGQAIYEGTVVHEGKTYEFEVDAASGTITKWE